MYKCEVDIFLGSCKVIKGIYAAFLWLLLFWNYQVQGVICSYWYKGNIVYLVHHSSGMVFVALVNILYKHILLSDRILKFWVMFLSKFNVKLSFWRPL